MTNLTDVFKVFHSVEFLERYNTDEERNDAIKGLQSKAISSFYSTYGYVILACFLAILIKIVI